MAAGEARAFHQTLRHPHKSKRPHELLTRRAWKAVAIILGASMIGPSKGNRKLSAAAWLGSNRSMIFSAGPHQASC